MRSEGPHACWPAAPANTALILPAPCPCPCPSPSLTGAPLHLRGAAVRQHVHRLHLERHPAGGRCFERAAVVPLVVRCMRGLLRLGR